MDRIKIRRALAYCIDLIAGNTFGAYFLGPLIAFSGVPLPEVMPQYVDTIGQLFGFFLYFFIFELFLQQTLGKVLLNLKVVQLDTLKTPPTFLQILRRTLFRFVPFEGLSLFQQDNAYHDLFSQTFVLKIPTFQEAPFRRSAFWLQLILIFFILTAIHVCTFNFAVLLGRLPIEASGSHLIDLFLGLSILVSSLGIFLQKSFFRYLMIAAFITNGVRDILVDPSLFNIIFTIVFFGIPLYLLNKIRTQ